MYRARAGDTLTAEPYERLDEDGRYRSELSRGRLVREPRPGAQHARIAADLYSELQQYVLEHGLGSLEIGSLSEIAIVREPDVIDGDDLLPGLQLRLDSFLPAYR